MCDLVGIRLVYWNNERCKFMHLVEIVQSISGESLKWFSTIGSHLHFTNKSAIQTKTTAWTISNKSEMRNELIKR